MEVRLFEKEEKVNLFISCLMIEIFYEIYGQEFRDLSAKVFCCLQHFLLFIKTDVWLRNTLNYRGLMKSNLSTRKGFFAKKWGTLHAGMVLLCAKQIRIYGLLAGASLYVSPLFSGDPELKLL